MNILKFLSNSPIFNNYQLFFIPFSLSQDNEAARRRRQGMLKTFVLQAAQKGLEARRARIEQRSVLKTYVSM
jgi:hypothetical protein